MFKRFDEKEDVSGLQQLKTSVQRGIRADLLKKYPGLGSYLDDILPKKEPLKLIKCKEHVELLATPEGKIIFFKTRDGPFLPTMRFLHQFPFLLPQQQVDKGAIKFVLSGAHIMCPGLTSPGAKLNETIAEGTYVTIMAEGKQTPLAVGHMQMSGSVIRTKNKGIGIDNVHCLNDGLWRMEKFVGK